MCLLHQFLMSNVRSKKLRSIPETQTLAHNHTSAAKLFRGAKVKAGCPLQPLPPPHCMERVIPDGICLMHLSLGPFPETITATTTPTTTTRQHGVHAPCTPLQRWPPPVSSGPPPLPCRSHTERKPSKDKRGRHHNLGVACSPKQHLHE